MKKIESSTKLCHFTSTESARQILSKGTFYLSKFNAMNDLAEAKLHDDEKDKIFSLSFCHSEALNIPLFYLYGGIDGKGCRLQFTPAKIEEIISNHTIHYVNKNNVCLRKAINTSDYSIDYDWIYYVASNGYCEYKEKQKSNYQTFDDAVESLKVREKHYYIKNLIWKFEKEFRIIIKFSEPVYYDKIALVFDVKDKERGISLVCGPEYGADSIETIKEEFSEYGITNVFPSTSNTISMNLCLKNKNIIKEH